jgi:hypothetical protein
MIRIATIAAAAMLGLASEAAHADPGPVQQRIDNQQQRINNGVATGALTNHEAAHDEATDARLQADRNRDLADHGGHLTPAERANLNRRLNHSSAHIYNTKHNARVAAPGH